MPLRRLIVLVAACAAAGLAVTACSSSASPAHGTAGPEMAPRAAPLGGKAAAGSRGLGVFYSGLPAGPTGATDLTKLAPEQSIIYTATLILRVSNADAVAMVAANDVAAIGGYVANEQETAPTGPGSLGQVSLQLKIPVTAYHHTVTELAALGRHVTFSQQAQDVTQEVADVTSRVASAQAAIKQLRELLSRAGNVGQLLTVQDEINSEESNLESLIAQQQSLAHETSYATVNLTLIGHRVPVHKKLKHRHKNHRGLVAGLSTGWRALKAVVVWLLTALGTLLPFAAPIAVIAGIIYVGRRRFTRRRSPAAPAPPATS